MGIHSHEGRVRALIEKAEDSTASNKDHLNQMLRAEANGVRQFGYIHGLTSKILWDCEKAELGDSNDATISPDLKSKNAA
jgi:hypothetical protein